MMITWGIPTLFIAIRPTNGESPYLEQGVQRVRNLEEAAALRTLEQARAWPGNPPGQLAKVPLWIGLALPRASTKGAELRQASAKRSCWIQRPCCLKVLRPAWCSGG